MFPYLHNPPFLFFFFNDTATTEIYTLSLHDALPISTRRRITAASWMPPAWPNSSDRKSTRLNSSHTVISYAVFCLKKKKRKKESTIPTKKRNKNKTNKK